MDFRCDAIFCCFSQDAVGLFYGEESCIAEHVNKVCKSFFCYSWKHFIAYKIDILSLTSFVSTSHGMSSEEVCFYHQRGCLLDASDYSEHLELILDCESVSALDLRSSGTHSHDFVHTDHCLTIQFIFRSFVKKICRVEDSTSSCCNLFVTQSCNLVSELTVTAACIHDVSVAVAECRHHKSAFCIDILGVFGTDADWRFPELSDDSVFDDEICIFDAFHLIHLGALKFENSFRKNTCQSTYIIYNSLHVI